MNIFYAWQADTPRSIGKTFIRSALDSAVSQISESMKLNEAERPSVDQDTQGVMGSPAIAETIFQKIRTSKVVVVDVTLVGETEAGKKFINSNVGYELGYAHGVHGDQVLITIMNTHYGPPKELPFDLRHRRWPVRFELAPDSTKLERKQTLLALAKELAEILKQYAEQRTLDESHEANLSLSERVKLYLSDQRYRIELDDLVLNELRAAVQEIQEHGLSLRPEAINATEFAQSVRMYEAAFSRLLLVIIILARWGRKEHQVLIERLVADLADYADKRDGPAAWPLVRWYPVMLMIYAGGIGALSAKNYLSLATLLATRISSRSLGEEPEQAAVGIARIILRADQDELFDELLGRPERYRARNAYMSMSLRPIFEDLLSLGPRFEDLFDRFEIFYALVYEDIVRPDRGFGFSNSRSPGGLFVFDISQGAPGNSYDAALEEAAAEGEEWDLLATGLFGGSKAQFNEIAHAYREQLVHNPRFLYT